MFDEFDATPVTMPMATHDYLEAAHQSEGRFLFGDLVPTSDLVSP